MKNNQKSKGSIVIIIILVILLAVAIGYIIYEKTNNEMKVQTKINNKTDQTILVEGNTFDLNGTSCVMENDSCIKEIQVAYNKKNHNIKVKYTLNDENIDEYNKYYKVTYYLYIDNKLIDTLEGGTLVTNDKEDLNSKYNGKLFVFQGKYLGFLRESNSPEGSSGYILTLYNNSEKIGSEQVIKISGQQLCYDKNCNKEINIVEDAEFDGKSYKFYQGDCDSGKIVLYSLTTDGQNIKREIDKKLKVNYDEAGSGRLGCYSLTKNAIK